MNAHDWSLVSYLKMHQGSGIDALADHLGVRERTVFSYIKHANAELAPSAQIIFKRDGSGEGGYYLAVDDQEQFQRLLVRGKMPDDLPQTPQERADYLVNDLLSRSDWITLDALSEMLYVSRATLSGDLRAVERELGRFGLTLERRPHYGLRVAGPEMSRRLCLADATLSQLRQSDSSMGGGSVHFEGESRLLGSFIDRDHVLEDVSACVSEALDETQLQVNSLVYHNLLVHICIALMRIESGHYVPLEGLSVERLKASPVYPVAEDIAGRIAEKLNVTLPESEVAYIAIHLAGKRTLGSDDADDGNLAISDEVWSIVSEMLDLIKLDFHFDFSADLELRMNLARHIVPLGTRLRYHLSMENPIREDIKARYPLAFSMASDAVSVLARTYESMPSEDEIGYIALAFALAIERQKTELPRKNIAIICASGQGSARLLAYRYREAFGAYLDRIVTCDVSRIDSLDLTGIDYVFTTVPLHRTMPVPVREVGMFLDDRDVVCVREAFRDGSCDAGVETPLMKYFDSRLFHAHLACTTKDEVLDLICAEVEQCHGVDPDFRDLVFQREALAPTAFGNSAAMPHPLRPASDETFFTVLLLEHPILWDGREVQAVFFLSIAREDREGLDAFYDQFSDVLMSEKLISRMVSDQRLETLIEIFGKANPNKGV